MRLVRIQGLIQNIPEAEKQFGQAGFNIVELPAYTHVQTQKYFCMCLCKKKKSTIKQRKKQHKYFSFIQKYNYIVRIINAERQLFLHFNFMGSTQPYKDVFHFKSITTRCLQASAEFMYLPFFYVSFYPVMIRTNHLGQLNEWIKPPHPPLFFSPALTLLSNSIAKC